MLVGAAKRELTTQLAAFAVAAVLIEGIRACCHGRYEIAAGIVTSNAPTSVSPQSKILHSVAAQRHLLVNGCLWQDSCTLDCVACHGMPLCHTLVYGFDLLQNS